VNEVADKLKALTRQMVECSEYQLKKRFMDALDANIAGEINRTYNYALPDVTFNMLQPEGVRVEQVFWLSEQSTQV